MTRKTTKTPAPKKSSRRLPRPRPVSLGSYRPGQDLDLFEVTVRSSNLYGF